MLTVAVLPDESIREGKREQRLEHRLFRHHSVATADSDPFLQDMPGSYLSATQKKIADFVVAVNVETVYLEDLHTPPSFALWTPSPQVSGSSLALKRLTRAAGLVAPHRTGRLPVPPTSSTGWGDEPVQAPPLPPACGHPLLRCERRRGMGRGGVLRFMEKFRRAAQICTPAACAPPFFKLSKRRNPLQFLMERHYPARPIPTSNSFLITNASRSRSITRSISAATESQRRNPFHSGSPARSPPVSNSFPVLFDFQRLATHGPHRLTRLAPNPLMSKHHAYPIRCQSDGARLCAGPLRAASRSRSVSLCG